MKKIVRFGVKCAETIIAFIVVALIFGFWRLSIAPIDVNFLIPTLTEMLSPAGSSYQADIKSAYLELGLEQGQFLEIRLDTLSLIGQDDEVLTTIPETLLTLSAFALLKGEIGLNKIILKKPFFQIILSEGESSKVNVLGAVGSLFDKISYLEEIRIDEAEMVIDDLNKKGHYSFPKFSLLVKKNAEDILNTHLKGEIYVNHKFMPFDLSGEFDVESNQFDFNMSAYNLYLSYFGGLIPQLTGADIPVTVKFSGNVDFNRFFDSPRKGITQLSFDVISEKNGSLFIKEPILTTYDIKDLFLHGEFSKNLSSLKIDDSVIRLYGPELYLDIDISGLDKAIDDENSEQVKTLLKAKLKNVPTRQITTLWPSGIGSSAHGWVKRNLSKGILPESDFVLSFTGDHLDDLSGLVKAKGVTVHYMEDMPVVTDAVADILLYPTHVDIEVTDGHIGQVRLEKAFLTFLDLDKDTEHTEMNIYVNGPVREVLEIADAPALGYVSSFGIDSSLFRGDSRTELLLKFPLSEDLTPSDVKVRVFSDMENVRIQTSFTTLNEGKMKLSVTNDQLILSGTAMMKSIPISFDWKENFNENQQDKSVYQLKSFGKIADLSPYTDAVQDYVKESFAVELVGKEDFQNETTFHGTLDLKNASLDLPFLSYDKKTGEDFSVDFSFKGFKEQKHKDISFTTSPNLRKKGIDIRGEFSLPFSRLTLKRVKLGLNNFSGDVRYKRGWNVNLKGNFLDLSQALHQTESEFEIKKAENTEQKQTKQKESEKESVSFKINMQLLKLASEKEPVQQAVIRGRKQGKLWKEMTFSMTALNSPVIGHLNKDGHFSMTTENFGNLLELSGYTHRIKGGKLNLEAIQYDDGTLQGTAFLSDYQLSEMTFLMQASTIIGLVDAFQNDRLSFSTAKVPFEITPERVLKINEAVAYGSALGFTMTGFASLKSVDLIGTIIPAYAVNSLFGKIPLIGSFLAPEKGGGLLSVNYSVKGDMPNPEISVNPLSVLAPGVIRKIFTSVPEEVKQ